jgi:hypothetical protein
MGVLKGRTRMTPVSVWSLGRDRPKKLVIRSILNFTVSGGCFGGCDEVRCLTARPGGPA